jgi:DNA repair exonuclease SbcCD ATPase subunit
MTTADLTPGWSSFAGNSLSEHGEAMIREQEDLQHRKKLYQTIALEGKVSPMRSHLAEKIEARMQEERLRDVQATVEVQQSCMSIKKHINSMSSLRKDLSSLRTEVEKVQPHRPPTCTVGLSMDFFKKSKKSAHHDDEEGGGSAAVGLQ